MGYHVGGLSIIASFASKSHTHRSRGTFTDVHHAMFEACARGRSTPEQGAITNGLPPTTAVN